MVFQTQSVTNEYQWLERNALVLAHNLHAHFIPLKTVSLDTSAHLLIPNVLPSISWDANSALGEAHAPLGYLRILGGIVDQFILSKTVAEGFGTNMQELRNIGDLKMRVEKQMLQVRCHVVLMCIALCDSVSHIKISVRAQKTMHLHCICTKPGYRISPKKKTPIFWLELVKKIPSKPGIHGRSFLQPRRFLHLDGIFHNFPIPHSSTISDCTGYTGGMPGPKKWNFCRSNMPPAWHHRVTVRPNQKPRFVKSLRCLEARKRRCITWIPNEIHQQRRQRSWTIWCFLVCGVGGWVGGNSTFPKRRSLLEGRAKKLPENLTRWRCREKWRITNPTSNVHLPLQSLPTPLPSSSEMLECKLRLRHSTATQRSGKRALHGHMASPSFPRLQGVVGKQLLANACLMLKLCRF